MSNITTFRNGRDKLINARPEKDVYHLVLFEKAYTTNKMVGLIIMKVIAYEHFSFLLHRIKIVFGVGSTMGYL